MGLANEIRAERTSWRARLRSAEEDREIEHRRVTLATLADRIDIETRGSIVDARPSGGRIVLVSSDDGWLSAGGGVSRALLRAAGPDVGREMESHVQAAGGHLPLGTTVVTSGGETGAAQIVHAVTVDWLSQRVVQHRSLEELVLRVLDHAAVLDADTVVIPRLATGAAGRSREEFDAAFVEALQRHVAAPTPLRRIVVCVADVPLSSRVPAFVAAEGEWPALDRRGSTLESLLSGHRGSSTDASRIRELAEDRSDPGWMHAWRAAHQVSQAARPAHPTNVPSAVPVAVAGIAATSFPLSLLPLGRVVLDAISERVSARSASTSATSEPDNSPLAGVERSAARPELPGRSPAERLAILLCNELPERTREHHLARLAVQGKKGGAREQITEWVLESNPRAILDELPSDVRAALAVDRAGLPEAKQFEPDAVKDAILTWLGFPVSPPPRGLRTFRSEVERLRAEAVLEPSRRDALIMSAGTILEELFKQLVAFHTGAFLGADIDTQLHAARVTEPGHPLARQTLGQLVIAAGKLGKVLRSTPGWSSQFGARHLLPSGADAVAHLRNAVTHHGVPKVEPEESFFDVAFQILDHLGDGAPPLAPLVVSIEQRIDSVMGRSYEGRDDQGTLEKIHTDAELVPGKRYYLLPRSNPVRVFPVVVAAM